MNYLPSGKEEVNLLKFISKYQYLNVSDTKYFFKSKRYYRNRVSNLISQRFIKKIKSKLVLDKLGIEYVKLFNFDYTRTNRNNKYVLRLLHLSHLGAFYNNCDTVNFIPSFSIKDKEVFTVTSRRFIGILEINGIDYLAYNISKLNDSKYIKTVIYDIEKERKYRNIIVFVNDINRIKLDDFCFGLNRVLIIEYNDNNLEKLKYLHSVNWSEVIHEKYKDKIHLSEYNFCDYTDKKNKYVSTFYFLDTEKITRIKYFLRENRNKNIDIICNNELESMLSEQLSNANYTIVNLEEYTRKEINIYE